MIQIKKTGNYEKNIDYSRFNIFLYDSNERTKK